MRVKDIPFYEGLYLVADIGNVISVYRERVVDGYLKASASKVFSTPPDSKGYVIVCLTDRQGERKSFSVHRLVAAAFVSPFSGETVNHIDGNRSNNHYTNLEWCDAAGNIMHGRLRKAQVYLTATQIMEIRTLKDEVPTSTLAKRYNVDASVIFRIWWPEK